MTLHIPILVEPIIQSLIQPLLNLSQDAPPHWIIDCTLGGGGHTQAILQALAVHPRLARHKVFASDQDPEACSRAQQRFIQEIHQGRLYLSHCRMSELKRVIPESPMQGQPILGILADFGFSSDQIEDPKRGLSFQREGPLDMRLDPSYDLSAQELLSQISEMDLARILFEYGEERYARRIAHTIIEHRKRGMLPTTTTQLADLVLHTVPPAMRHRKIHPATRTFQALRIRVNNEMAEIDAFLKNVIFLLEKEGRVAVLSFHSLEDRCIKRAFKDRSIFKQLTKKPIVPSANEIQANPRSRSAKLRIAERIA